MKLYTKRGDDGATDLFGGGRVAKDSPRVEAFGAVDEANCCLGWAAAACGDAEMLALLRTLQTRLFELGSDLASPVAAGHEAAPARPSSVPRIGGEHVAEAEAMIDRLFAPLPPMRNFILPGGSELASRLHVARAVCRRAERACVALAKDEPLEPAITIYLNRLSDLLFAAARRANQLTGVEDIPWSGGR